jgi:hypothetical protein
MHHNYNNNSKNDKSPWGSFANAMHLHDLIFISILPSSPTNTREIEMSVKSVITIIIMLLK